MEQRQIKFRGKTRTGKIVFGDLATWDFNGNYSFSIRGFNKQSGGYEYFEIVPDSIAQLCGYDDDGKEVYEGDKVVDGNGNEYTVRFYAMGVNDEDCVSLDYDGKLCFKLKEEV